MRERERSTDRQNTHLSMHANSHANTQTKVHVCMHQNTGNWLYKICSDDKKMFTCAPNEYSPRCTAYKETMGVRAPTLYGDDYSLSCL